jgi:hypothetical protein
MRGADTNGSVARLVNVLLLLGMVSQLVREHRWWSWLGSTLITAALRARTVVLCARRA